MAESYIILKCSKRNFHQFALQLLLYSSTKCPSFMLRNVKPSWDFMPGESRMNSTSQPFYENGRVKMVIEENRFIQDCGVNCYIIFPGLCFIG